VTAGPTAPITRTFLVGCPRSGTTLLQSLLYAHPDVFSCPETFFFVKAFNLVGRRHRLGLAAEGAPEACRSVVALGLADRAPRETALPRTEASYARWFARALDSAARDAGKGLWIEKTPTHLARVDAISRRLPRARFVHIVRAGAPTVASLFQVTRDYPESWDGARDIEACATRWSRDVELSARHAGRSGHVFVSYERLVSDAPAVISALCAALGLRRDDGVVERMIGDYAGRAERVRLDEPWKHGTTAPLVNRNADRLETLFDSEQRETLQRLLAPAERRRASLPFL
jgi:hypothetical protein